MDAWQKRVLERKKEAKSELIGTVTWDHTVDEKLSVSTTVPMSGVTMPSCALRNQEIVGKGIPLATHWKVAELLLAFKGETDTVGAGKTVDGGGGRWRKRGQGEGVGKEGRKEELQLS